jgi:hypothetical protein
MEAITRIVIKIKNFLDMWFLLLREMGKGGLRWDW